MVTQFNLPEDFDSEVYLELNPDVAQAEMDAKEHYLKYGMYEKWRKYKREERKEQINLTQDYTHLDEYMSSGFQQIQGWCLPTLSEICKLIDSYQHEKRVEGGVAEIGVHYGLFFILLNHLCQPGISSWAMDVFENQELNIDNSGAGSYDIFLSNLKKYDRYKGENVNIIACDSTTARLTEMITTPIRIFSIDGGHTAEHTISDLKTAQSVLHPEGVVIVDDILNAHWLGVMEGCVYFLQSKPTLVPFGIGYNKLFMCNLSYVEKYASLLRNSPLCTKPKVRFMGWDIVAL